MAQPVATSPALHLAQPCAMLRARLLSSKAQHRMKGERPTERVGLDGQEVNADEWRAAAAIGRIFIASVGMNESDGRLSEFVRVQF